MANKLEVIDQREVLGKQFRMYGTINEPLFLARDVAEWIDYAKRDDGSYQTGQMLKSVDEEEKVFASTNNISREQWFPI